mgnify:CR=1 FL=1
MNSEVVNIRKKELNKRGIKDFSEWVKDNKRIYIGRNMCVYVPGTHASKWANKYSVKKYGLEKCLELYENDIRNSELMNQLSELDNSELGCWCAPNKCHGDILIKLRLEQLNQLE